MKGKKRFDFISGDVFAIPLENGKHAIGQILDQRLPNTVRIALFDEVIDNHDFTDLTDICDTSHLISLIEVTKEQIVFGVWRIIGNKELNIPISRYPNEQFRQDKWVNSTFHDAALAEDFLNAFYALIPWDDWYEPDYLDKYLVDISKKPAKLILVKTA